MLFFCLKFVGGFWEMLMFLVVFGWFGVFAVVWCFLGGLGVGFDMV